MQNLTVETHWMINGLKNKNWNQSLIYKPNLDFDT